MTDQKQCFICADQRQNSLEQHHIVPKRFGGSDDEENVVTLCASCHAAIEKLYDRRFYGELGVEKPGASETCELDDCTASASKSLDGPEYTLDICDSHAESCGASLGLYDGCCTQTAAHVVRSYYDNTIKLRCDDHCVCGKSGCKSQELYFDPESALPYQRCIEHFDSSESAEEQRRTKFSKNDE